VRAVFLEGSKSLKTNSLESVNCEFCGHEGSQLRFDFGDSKIFFCRTCQTSFTHPKPNEKALAEVYNENYFTNEKLSSGDVNHTYGYQDFEKTKQLNAQSNTRICRELLQLFNGDCAGKSLLDYGCGLGAFLTSAAEAGFNVEGVEFNEFAAKRVEKKFNYKIYDHNAINEIKENGTRYDVITLFDVFEHLLEPQRTLLELHGLLNENGILVIGTTDFNHIIPRILGKHFEDFRRIREHIFFLGKKQLLSLVKMSGFRHLKTQPQKIRLGAYDLACRLEGMKIPGAGLLKAVIGKTALKNLLLPINFGMKYLAYFSKNEIKAHTPPASNLLTSPVKLTIVIPVYNEEKTIEHVIERVLAVKIKKVRTNLIVVDDGSTDNSRMILNKLQDIHKFQLILQPKNGGKGSAIREGIKHADGDLVIIQDADLEYEPNDYEKLIAPIISDNADAVYGSRFLSPERRVMGFWHTYGNKFLTFFCNLVVNRYITDMETCYKVMRTDIAKSLNLRSRRFDVEPEITCKLALNQHRIYEVPIRYHARSFKEGKKIGMKDLFQALWAIFKYGILRLK